MWYPFKEAINILNKNIINPIHCRIKIYKSGGSIVEGFGTFNGYSFNDCTTNGIVKQVFIK